MVTVKLYGQARRLTGSAEVRLEIEGQTRLQELLRRILKSEDLTPSRSLQAILINGRNCIFLGGLDAPVQDGDTIEILPLVTGG
jgi:molybdopterin converting factor small subunit